MRCYCSKWSCNSAGLASHSLLASFLLEPPWYPLGDCPFWELEPEGARILWPYCNSSESLQEYLQPPSSHLMSVLASLLQERELEEKYYSCPPPRKTAQNSSIKWAFFLNSFAKTIWPNGITGSRSNFHPILVVDGKLAWLRKIRDNVCVG